MGHSQPDLAVLARQATTRDPTVRANLAIMLADTFQRGPIADASASALVEGLLTDIVRQAAADVKLAIAQKLASAPWAPHALIVELAHDGIDIARPVIARSRALLEADLVALAERASEDHVVEVARRPDLPAAVSDAIADRGCIDALCALLNNRASTPSPRAFDVAIDAASVHPILRRPLSVHTLLPPQLAAKLYALVGEELREALAARFNIDAAAFDPAFEAITPRGLDEAAEEAESAALVERLMRSGALTPGFALRAIIDGKVALFELALSRLAGLTPGQLRAAIEAGGVWAAALACRAAGIDRAAFSSVYRGLAAFGRLPPKPSADIARRAVDVFETQSREGALEVLRRLAGTD